MKNRYSIDGWFVAGGCEAIAHIMHLISEDMMRGEKEGRISSGGQVTGEWKIMVTPNGQEQRLSPCEVGIADCEVKPSLGVIPRKLFIKKRLNEIIEAIKRYHDGHYIIPAEWFEESAEICRWLEKQK